MKLHHILFAGLTAVALSACDESFNDWTTPTANEQATQISFGAGTFSGVTSLIDFATLGDAQMVQVCKLTPPTASTEGYTTTYSIELDDAKTFDLTANGEMKVADLKEYIVATWGQAPTEHAMKAIVTAFINNDNDGTRFSSDSYTLTAKLNAPEIEQAYYLTGSLNGWDNTDTTYELTNDGSDPYANPTFTCRIPAPADGSNVEFKFTPKSGLGGDWSKCLAAGNEEGTFAYGNAGGNLVITAVEGAKFYDLTFNMLELTWSYKAVNFNPFIYFIGATDGWKASDQKLAHQGDGLYTGYCYVADPNGWGLAFKFQRVAGSWDEEINGGTFTTKTGVTGDNNIEVAEAGVYYFTVNLAEGSIDAVKINNMNLVGDFNGWKEADDAQQMTWNATDFCFEITGAGVTANGWKFTANNAWTINLGGELTNLVGNGSNLSAVGSTIKLYPTRSTNDNIYCTVE